MSSVLLLVSWNFLGFLSVLCFSFHLSGIMFQKDVAFTTSRGRWKCGAC